MVTCLPYVWGLPDDLVSLVTQGKSFSACEAYPCGGVASGFLSLRREKTCHNVIDAQ